MEHGLCDISPVELAAVASSLSDSGRAAILISLLDGRARTASELAFVAGVSPQTASAHLARLVDTGLVSVVRQGRHRYHRLTGPEAAHVMEALAVIAATPPRRHRIPGPRDRLLREGRTCYDHFAGRLGVAIADALLAAEAIIERPREGGGHFEITTEGERRLAMLEVDVPALRRESRPLCRCCIDWSERRPHIAGAVGAQLTTNALRIGWVQRLGDTRGVSVTPMGRSIFRDAIGLDLDLPLAA
jgi:DNA-binding transcriptional ArsR family regulator